MSSFNHKSSKVGTLPFSNVNVAAALLSIGETTDQSRKKHENIPTVKQSSTWFEISPDALTESFSL